MASSIQLLRSTIAQERPFPGNLLEGQPAVNLNASEPGLFFKAADGSLVKFGPAAITSDGSPPNSSPQGSSGNTVGELWLDKSTDPAVLKVYDGTGWVDAGSGGGGGGSGSFVRWIYTAIGGETSLSGSSGGVLLDYTPGLEEVFINGVLITRGTDYSATNGSSITNLAALTTGDVVTVFSMNPVETVQLPGQVSLLRWTILAAAGQTVFSGVDSSSQQLAYTAGFEEVYVNGAFLRRGVDYTATDGSTVTISSPLAEDDEVTVMAWSPMEVGQITIGTSNIENEAVTEEKLSDTIFASKFLYKQSPSAITRSLQGRLIDAVYVEDFGADPTGALDSSSAIAAGVNYCQNNGLQSLHFGPGIFKLTQTVYLGLPRGISLIGQLGATNTQGSSRPATVLRWAGGAAPMFEVDFTFYRFYNMSVENTTIATEFILANNAMHMEFDHVDGNSGANGPVTYPFSNAFIRGVGNQFGYSVWRHCQCSSVAPSLVEIDGQGQPNGTTTLRFYNNIFEAGSAYSMSVLKLIDNSVDIVSFQDNTFNQQGNVGVNGELCILDTLGFISNEISCLNVIGNEFDVVSTEPSHRVFKLKNVRNANFIGNQFVMGGSVSNAVDLINSNVTTFSGNLGYAINGPILNADSTSRVWVGANHLNIGNSSGIVNEAPQVGIVTLQYGPLIGISGNAVPANGLITYRVDVNDGNAWSIFPQNPLFSPPYNGYLSPGQTIALQIRNISGGPMGVITPTSPSNWKLSAPLPMPANGFNQTVILIWNGSAFVELSRTATDIPN
jgi:hypothetical protein